MQEELKESSIFTSADATELTNLLIDFLCTKYTLSGMNLARKLEEKEKNLKEKFKANWSKIRQILTYKKHPNPSQYYPPKPDRGITVILPKNDQSPETTWEFFKGAAYFPFQIDPQAYEEWEHDKDILIQLAFATYHRYFAARRLLVLLDIAYPELKGHRLCKYKEIPAVNAEEIYYELNIPEIYHGKDVKVANTLSFDWKNDKDRANAFFDNLLDIARNGPSRDLTKDI